MDRRANKQSCILDQVTDIKTFWTWADLHFLPEIFTPEAKYSNTIAQVKTVFADNAFHIDWSPRPIGRGEINVLLGSIRLRQLRVQKGRGCKVSSLVNHVFPICRGLFTELFQSTTEYESEIAPTYTHKHYGWMAEEETEQIAMTGAYADYPGSGYVMDVPLFRTEAHILVHDLWNFQWLDSSTR